MEGLLPPEHGPDPGQELGGGEGLGQVVVRPGVQPLHPLGDLGAGGEEEGGGGDPLPAQLLQDLDPVQPRHHNVQHQAVVLHGLGIGEGLPSVGHPIHREFMAFKDMD